MQDELAQMIEHVGRIQREVQRQEDTHPGECLHVFLRHGDGDECVCVKCSLRVSSQTAQDYLDGLPKKDKSKSLLERLHTDS